jgi:hypothetical protein
MYYNITSRDFTFLSCKKLDLYIHNNNDNNITVKGEWSSRVDVHVNEIQNVKNYGIRTWHRVRAWYFTIYRVSVKEVPYLASF